MVGSFGIDLHTTIWREFMPTVGVVAPHRPIVVCCALTAWNCNEDLKIEEVRLRHETGATWISPVVVEDEIHRFYAFGGPEWPVFTTADVFVKVKNIQTGQICELSAPKTHIYAVC